MIEKARSVLTNIATACRGGTISFHHPDPRALSMTATARDAYRQSWAKRAQPHRSTPESGVPGQPGENKDTHPSSVRRYQLDFTSLISSFAGGQAKQADRETDDTACYTVYSDLNYPSRWKSRVNKTRVGAPCPIEKALEILPWDFVRMLTIVFNIPWIQNIVKT